MGRRRVGPQAIQEYLGRMRQRYEQAERRAKGPLLDEVCEMTLGFREVAKRTGPQGELNAAYLQISQNTFLELQQASAQQPAVEGHRVADIRHGHPHVVQGIVVLVLRDGDLGR